MVVYYAVTGYFFVLWEQKIVYGDAGRMDHGYI